MTVFVVGNPLSKIDSLPLKLIWPLKNAFPNLTFTQLDPNEDLLPSDDQPLIIIDAVIGIAKVTLFTSLDDFLINRRVSLHDYDLGFHLKLLQKMGKIKKFKIIGIPPKLSEKEAFKQTVKVIRLQIREKN